MGSSWAFVCSAVLVLVALSSATKDEHIVEQRPITFDADNKDVEVPDSLLLQREVDLTELFDLRDFFTGQVIVPPSEQLDSQSEREGSRPGVLTPGRQPGFGGRSFGPYVQDYDVQFPLARPTHDNLQAICLHGDRRRTYPDSYFPASGFSKLKRMAGAVNMAESRFSTCCEGNQTWGREATLCCARQAWELSVKSFCKEDTSVKDRLYECCRGKGDEMLNCFDRKAPNPNYEPTEEIPLPPLPSTVDSNFDPLSCQRTVMTPYRIRGNKRTMQTKPSTSHKTDINFPLGRPTADNIESLCLNQNQRPLYNVKCLPGVDYEWLARQAKTINRMEKGFKQCCKKKQDVLNCADRKWSEELDRFCLKSRHVDFHCCSGDGANERYNCFQNISSDPHYTTYVTSATEELSLNKICDTHKIIKKTFPGVFPLKSLVGHCCPLPEQEKATCSAQKLEEMSATLCSSGGTAPPVVRRCCRMPTQKTSQCVSKILVNAISKATKALHQKKKKRCPIS